MRRRRGGDDGHVRGTRPGGGGVWGERSGLVYSVSVVGAGGWSLEMLSVKDCGS